MAALGRLSQHEQIPCAAPMWRSHACIAFELRLRTYKDGQENRRRKTAADRFRAPIHPPEESVPGDTQHVHVRLTTAEAEDHAAVGVGKERAGP